MSHSGAPSAVISPQPQAPAPKKPTTDETRTFTNNEGEPSFEVTFKKNAVVIKRVGEPNILRTINQKYGNIRTVDGQMKQVADDIIWHLFNLTDNT